MVILGGAFLITPGFITDVIGAPAPDPAVPGDLPRHRRPLAAASRRLRSRNRRLGSRSRRPASAPAAASATARLRLRGDRPGGPRSGARASAAEAAMASAEPAAIILEAPTPASGPCDWPGTASARRPIALPARRARRPLALARRGRARLGARRGAAARLGRVRGRARARARRRCGRGEPRPRPRLRSPHRLESEQASPVDRAPRRSCRPSTTPTAYRGGSGVELWIDPDSPPLRVAADRRGEVEVEVDGDGVRREVAAMSFRLDGTAGAGAYELLRPRLTVAIRAVISDFGGVLTTPLLGSFTAFQDETGISAESLGGAMQRIAERDGEHPLFELERGRITEADFLAALRDGADRRARARARAPPLQRDLLRRARPERADDRADARPERPRLPDGAPDQQRSRVGAAVAARCSRSTRSSR